MSTGKYGTSRPETEALLALLNPGDPDGAYALQIVKGMSRDERHRLRRVCEQIEREASLCLTTPCVSAPSAEGRTGHAPPGTAR